MPQTLVKVGWIEEKYDLIKVLRKVNPRFQSVDSLLGKSLEQMAVQMTLLFIMRVERI